MDPAGSISQRNYNMFSRPPAHPYRNASQATSQNAIGSNEPRNVPRPLGAGRERSSRAAASIREESEEGSSISSLVQQFEDKTKITKGSTSTTQEERPARQGMPKKQESDSFFPGRRETVERETGFTRGTFTERSQSSQQISRIYLNLKF